MYLACFGGKREYEQNHQMSTHNPSQLTHTPLQVLDHDQILQQSDQNTPATPYHITLAKLIK